MPTPQHGILDRPPSHLLLAALNFAGERSPASTWPALDALEALLGRELARDLDQLAGAPKDQPPAETGELGVDDKYPSRSLTVTLGISNLGFDALGVAQEQLPQDLPPVGQTIWDLIEETPELTTEPGDLLLQIRSEDPYINEHVVRRVESHLGDKFSIAWTQLGENRYTARSDAAKRKRRHEARALIGFLDGTSNLRPAAVPEDRALVFVNPDKVGDYPPLPPAQSGYDGSTFPPPGLRDRPAREPEWTREGSYLVVRASLNRIHDWDATSYDSQEKTIGRFKASGASLDLADDPAKVDDPPAFAADQTNLTVPLNAHVRKVNPRRPEDLPRRIFRRGYPLVERDRAGMRRGLVFISFARTISTQFEFIFRAWMNNPNFPRPAQGQAAPGKDQLLERFDQQPVVGGYYFVPALHDEKKPASWVLPRPAS